MDKPISVGDLVMVVGACCSGTSEYLGEIHRVLEIHNEGCECDDCGSVDEGMACCMLKADFSTDDWSLPPSYLKRIPPQEELEGKRDASGLDERKKSPLVEGDLAAQRSIYDRWVKA